MLLMTSLIILITLYQRISFFTCFGFVFLSCSCNCCNIKTFQDFKFISYVLKLISIFLQFSISLYSSEFFNKNFINFEMQVKNRLTPRIEMSLGLCQYIIMQILTRTSELFLSYWNSSPFF